MSFSLSKADKYDFKRLWSVYRAVNRLSNEYEHSEIEEMLARLPKNAHRNLGIILGRLNYSTGFLRVVAGCEILIKECCDPDSEVYAPKQIAKAKPNTDEWVDQIMAQASVYASAWSLVGGRFDNGDGLAHAEQMKAELRQMLSSGVQS